MGFSPFASASDARRMKSQWNASSLLLGTGM